MKKLTMQTPDLTEGNVTKIAQLFPNVITEKEGSNGVVEKVVDFELLKQMLSKELVEDDGERYRLDWPGKKASLLKANTPVTKTLRPDRDSSVNFDTTENVFIEGDNFEVLKVLQESYLGKVKMIYIDPPYNTGKDFVYKDNFSQSKDEYDEELGVEDEEGGKLFRNTDTNGRFHSDWLSMIYERLTVARDLLANDGVIFMSIDDNEITNLRKICDEVFGEENFIESIVWNKRIPKNDKGIGNIHEYILVYVKDSSYKHEFIMQKEGLEEIDDLLLKLKNKSTSIKDAEEEVKKLYKKMGYDRGITLYNSLDDNYDLWGKINMSWPNANTFGPRYDVLHPKTKKPVKVPDRGWRWIKESFDEASGLVDGEYANIKELHDGTFLCNRIWFDKDEKIQPSSVNYLKDVETFLLRSVISMKSDGGVEVEKIFEGKSYFSYPKPTSLIKLLLSSFPSKDHDIVLDFFAGSATTSHAVMQLNAEDGGNRKFVLVQIQEETEETSEACKAGYKYISDISKERIRRAGKKILEENAETLASREKPLDIGFRVYKADTTNMKDVYYHPSQVVQEDLFNLVSNIKEDRTPEDLLTQVILNLGLALDLPIEKKELRGNAVYFVAGNALVACFDDKIDFGVVDDIATYEPLKVVFKDASFKEEQDRTNVETRMKRLSPETIITVL